MMQFELHIRGERQLKLYIDDESKPLLSKMSDESLRLAAQNSDYYFTAERDYFKGLQVFYRDDEKVVEWNDIFLKGVNMGVAVPGKFPAEFSLSFEQYLEWIRLIGDMNANIIRLYTILPPDFYEALAYYNLYHSDRPVYLMQGVWAEVPESEDYYDPAFIREFEKEIIDVTDVIHGHAELRERPGKASGVYSTDVSRYVAAILLGREWEPGSVSRTNRMNTIVQYSGDFVSMNMGSPMEAWLARMMDFAVLYETQQYRFQHPVSFVNWLPLDPMYHNTEIIENKRVREYDNDLESLDFRRFHSTDLFYPGIYAAYHVYPYYPDFIYLQESYVNPGSSDSIRGPFYHYLLDLKKHNEGMPLVIAEYGLPSSRGNSHFSPFGLHQGGHSESDQAALSLQLTRDIADVSCAGAVYFEWIDEWFKHNWLVMDFEVPEDDRKLWHNMENPEQNFGILALENKTRSIDGQASDWPDGAISGSRGGFAFHADATYFYIAGSIPGFDLHSNNLYLAFDTYDSEKGDHRLPFSDEIFDNGFEFLGSFYSPDSAFILVDEPYSVYTDIYNGYVPAYASRNNSNGQFIRQLMLTNRSRTSLTGVMTDSVVIDRSRLQSGLSTDPATSNADWYFDKRTGVLEMRFDWHLLNVTDPAKRYVLDDREGTSEIDYSATDAFRIIAFVTDKQNNVNARYPASGLYSYAWEGWMLPEFTSRLKPVYDSLKEYFHTLEPKPALETKKEEEEFVITGFYNDKAGAISISFNNASFSQYDLALPVLNKYGIRASFGVNPAMLDNSPRMMEFGDDPLMKRLSIREVKEISAIHEIALQLLPGETADDEKFYLLREKSEAAVLTLHAEIPKHSSPAPRSLVFVRRMSKDDLLRTTFGGVEYSVSATGLAQPELKAVLDRQMSKWTIFEYNHLFENPSAIPHQLSEKEADRIFIAQQAFEQQVRLFRNSGYWIAPEISVFKYLKERERSSLKVERYQNMVFLEVLCPLDPEIFNIPLTIEYTTAARIIRLEGSESDGIFTVRNGKLLFNAKPNKEIIIGIIE
jgi:hypothetical protein